MPIAQDAADYIFQGIWTNWQKGRVIGLTLTVNQFHATILSPALAVLIAIAGSQLWRLFQYVLHQVRATSAPRDFLFHQQQVSLRNTTADLNALWRLIRLAFAWRHQKNVHVLRNTLPLVFWTVLHLLLVIAASLFSSTLLNAGDQVLSRSPWCGTFNQTIVDNMYAGGRLSDDVIKQIMEFTSYINTAYSNIQQHVDLCSATPTSCGSSPTSMLNFTTSTLPGACPFENSICHPAIQGSMSFDTGYLSSSSHFGFNAVKQNRISFRLVAECAPLDDAHHVSSYQNINATDTSPAYQIADAFYGPSSISERNATFSAVKQYSTCEQRKNLSPYMLSSQSAKNGADALFDPIPELQTNDSDLSLVLLTFNGAYQGPVSDPWFSAQREATENTTYCDHEERTLYSRELPITTIGCTQRWQLCNQDIDHNMKENSCTPLLAYYDLQDFVDSTSNSTLPLNPRQQATYTRLIQASNGAFISDVINYLSQSNTVPLQARHLVDKTVSLALPANQWQIETKYWFTILLTYLQQVSLMYSTGQFAASTEYINATQRSPTNDPLENAAYNLCQNQIIRSHNYENFNFFALLLVVIICVVITILGLTIDDIIGSIRQRQLRYTEYDGKQDMWMLNSDLEMLKVISELKSGAAWTKSKNGVPLAQPGHEVGVFELASDSWEVGKEEGKGIVHKRTRTGLEQIALGDMSRGRGVKRCATCTMRSKVDDGVPAPTYDYGCDYSHGHGHGESHQGGGRGKGGIGIFGRRHKQKDDIGTDADSGVIVYEHEIPYRGYRDVSPALDTSISIPFRI